MVYKKKNGYCVFNQENVRSDSVIWSWKYFSSSDEESWIKKKKTPGQLFHTKVYRSNEGLAFTTST